MRDETLSSDERQLIKDLLDKQSLNLQHAQPSYRSLVNGLRAKLQYWPDIVLRHKR